MRSIFVYDEDDHTHAKVDSVANAIRSILYDGNGNVISTSDPLPVDLQGSNTTQQVEGTDSEGSAASANPVRLGGVYQASPTTVDDGDIVSLLTDAEGRPQVDIVTIPNVTVEQSAHDNLQANANVQQGDSDVGSSNPLHTQIGDGNDATQGAQGDAATTDHTSSNSLMSFIKGHTQILSDVWVDGSNWLQVSVQDIADFIASHTQHDDGTGTWENTEGNTELTSLISAAGVTTEQASADQTNPNARGILLHVSLSNTAGTPAYTPRIEANMNGTYVEVFQAASTIGSDGQFAYFIYPAASYSGGGELQESADIAIPRTWRVRITADTADGSNQSDIDVNASPIV